jgi:phospholipid/cholesterol/gamma-HCH transport system substrate-binding protein
LLGDRYISLQNGGDPKILGNGDTISFTESAVLLERLLGKLVHNVGASGKESE